MVHIVNIHEAKTQLSKLIEEVERGEEVTIARAGVPCVKLVAVDPPKREFGFLKGMYPPIPDEVMFAPIPEEDLDEWEASLGIPVRLLP